MIHIKFGNKQPPMKWLDKARQLNQKLDAAESKEERDTIIDLNSKVWGELKCWLLNLSHGKCWFSEAKDTFSHWDVEHFRPKKSAKDMDGNDREGYWWLAFDWHNYRICGNVGNRMKGTFFPLCEGSRVASSNARHLIEDEIPLLLDPVREGDPEHLSFNEEGMANPMPGLGGWPKQRAEESIKRYKLNDHEPLREARQRVWEKCRKQIEKALEPLQASPPTASSQEKLRCAFEELKEMLSHEEPFTSVTRECLNSSGYRWAQRITSEG